jgi:hypothetical protein
VPWRHLVALAIVVTGAVAVFAIYTFGWHDEKSDTPPTPAVAPAALTPKRFTGLIGSKRLYTIRYGDVVRYPGTATLCQATAEGGYPQLFCVHARRSRFQAVFTDSGLRVYDLRPPNDGFESDFDLPGELKRGGS